MRRFCKKVTQRTGWITALFCVSVFCLAMATKPLRVQGAGAVYTAYQKYEAQFARIQTIADIKTYGYEVVEKHVFDVPLVSYPEAKTMDAEMRLEPSIEVTRPEAIYRIGSQDAVALQELPTVRFYCALEQKSHRAAVFLADADGQIIYKTNQLECNYTVLGEMNQPIYDVLSVAFQDLNGDHLTDIILIAGTIQQTENGQRKRYKVGEVLFQQAQEGQISYEESDTQPVFYRDWRINDKINRYGMNQSAKSIRSFVRDGKSTEFLYKATTEEELLQNGFQVIEEQSYRRTFEKLGSLKILPGYYSLGDYDIFMIYMVNEQGAIVWSFEPMGDYDNLYALKGISNVDLDGDGMKDMLVLARYSKEEDDGSISIDTCYDIYYQRTDGFEKDTECRLDFKDKSKEEQTVSNLVNEIRLYWGWQIEPKNR